MPPRCPAPSPASALSSPHTHTHTSLPQLADTHSDASSRSGLLEPLAGPRSEVGCRDAASGVAACKAKGARDSLR
eukprot:1688222-Rhodomonas_salina.1